MRRLVLALFARELVTILRRHGFETDRQSGSHVCPDSWATGDGMDYEQFAADERTVDAVIRNFLVIGEATRHVPPDVRFHEPRRRD